MKHGRWPGTYIVVCDVCGFRFASDKVKKRWDGLITCEKDWEVKHPQLFLRVRETGIGVTPARPEPPDVFVNVCTLWGVSDYAGLATAGCAKAGNNLLPYAFLLALKNGTS